MEDIVRQRVINIFNEYHINPSQFSGEDGAMQKRLSRQLKGGASVTCETLLSILDRYNDVSAEWLLRGEGEMLKPSLPEVQRINTPKSYEPTSDQDVALYDINAAANLKTLLGDKSQNIIGKIHIPDIPKCDGAVYVKGDSMYPLLKSGDIIAYKEVYNFDNVVRGEMYLVSFELDGDEYLTVKYINSSEKEGCVKLVSYNSHHDPMDIPINAIYAMALVKVSIRMNTMR